MRILVTFLLMTLATSIPAVAQKESSKDKNPLPTHSVIQFQLVRTDGSNIFLVQDRLDPKKKPQESTYTVKVPVTRTVVVDGKSKTVTEFVLETRTRMVRPTIRTSVPVSERHLFKTADGKKLSKVEVIGRLGMGNGKLVVSILPGQKLLPELKAMLNKDAITMEVDIRTPK